MSFFKPDVPNVNVQPLGTSAFWSVDPLTEKLTVEVPEGERWKGRGRKTRVRSFMHLTH